MKSKITITLITVLIIGLIGLVSCKKEDETTNGTREEIAEISEQFLNQITDFLNLAEQVKKGNVHRSTVKVPIDTATYYIDGSLNYKYGFGTYLYKSLHIDSVEIALPIIATENKTYMVDVAEGYNQAVTLLREKYYEIQADTVVLKGCVVQQMGRTPANDTLFVRVIGHFAMGIHPGTLLSYSGLNDAYWWSRGSYNCNQNIIGMGAPDIFDQELSFVFRPAPPPNIRYVFYDLATEAQAFSDPIVYPNPNDIVPNDNFCDYKLFYVIIPKNDLFTDELMCLGTHPDFPGIHEMYFYRQSMREIIEEWLNNNQKSFFSVITLHKDEEADDYKMRYHVMELTHGKIRQMNCGPVSYYPINITED